MYTIHGVYLGVFMNLLERVLTLLRANVNTMVEKADDPEKVLKQLQLDMRNQLVQVKTQVATAIAEGHKLQKRSKEMTAEADMWLKKAEQAIQQNHDDTARTALTRHNDMLKQAQRYQQQQKQQEQLVVTMRSVLRQLEAKIAEVETTIELLVARKRNALIQQRVFDALNKTGAQKDTEHAPMAQDAVLEAEARARALAELHKRALDTQLDQLTQEHVIERQMRELKAKHQPPQEQPSPLLPPQVQKEQPVKKRAGAKSAQGNGADKEADTAQLKKLLQQP